MICYECKQSGTRRDATALCHHCCAALCSEHAAVLSDPVTEQYPVLRVVVLPLQARVFLCDTCKQALEQTTKWNPAKDHIGQFVPESDLVHNGGLGRGQWRAMLPDTDRMSSSRG
jgi:hypothetical protein